MKRYLLLLLQLFILTTLSGQTIIDLKPGGGVRSKRVEELRQDEPGLAEKLRADSIQYNDNLIRALNALHRDSLDYAEGLLKEALKLRPNATSNYIVHQYLGRIAMARGDYRDAISTFTVILKNWPGNREARFDRASCYLEIKNTQAALEDCLIIFKGELTKEERIKALFLRSACHTESRHPEKAKTDLEEIISLDPTNESAQLLLAFSYQQIGQPMEALDRLNLFVTSHPESVEGWLARAQMEEEQDMLEAARADYDQVIRIAAKDPVAYARRARLLIKMNLPKQAEKDIRQAILLGYPAEPLLQLLPKNK